MIATGWLSLRAWQEPGRRRPPTPMPDAESRPCRTCAPPCSCGWPPSTNPEWVALDDLAGHLAARSPAWDRLTIAVAAGRHAASRPAASGAPMPSPRAGRRRRAAGLARRPSRRAGARLLESILLGAAYPLGLVRAAEERGTGRRVVQLTPLGRYVLAAGPTPPPRPTFEQFLFVQPNFEVIAYRQGLTPQLVGRLSRFAWWAQVGAALELRLTRESIVFGLDGGLTPESMLDVAEAAQPAGPARRRGRRRPELGHAPRAGDLLRGGDADRVRLVAPSGTWPWSPGRAGDERSRAADRRRPIGSCWSRTSERSRSTGFAWPARATTDGRRKPAWRSSPTASSMALDPARSDLLVDAELGRFADELPPAHQGRIGRGAGPRDGSW